MAKCWTFQCEILKDPHTAKYMHGSFETPFPQNMNKNVKSPGSIKSISPYVKCILEVFARPQPFVKLENSRPFFFVIFYQICKVCVFLFPNVPASKSILKIPF